MRLADEVGKDAGCAHSRNRRGGAGFERARERQEAAGSDVPTLASIVTLY
jgi:hypothetical protein